MKYNCPFSFAPNQELFHSYLILDSTMTAVSLEHKVVSLFMTCWQEIINTVDKGCADRSVRAAAEGRMTELLQA